MTKTEIIKHLIAAGGVSKQQAVIELIDTVDLSAARRIKLDGILDKVLKRDAELLERLADA